ncbi:type II secretion system F family protein [Cellulomonas carbonis]|uniref:Membrane protein n=1 Tax=Cellulomonas carbonis T26 TaxID=947969 RepID=A0A0A0BVD6_9CELL|nr:type II secretion system F family protein [Cellulomonas carbonis]KGM11881.1 membrane protein [Cellulomonas carbonis T26]GGB91520.1 type II secretion system protein [Cellulomonas carbonis]
MTLWPVLLAGALVGTGLTVVAAGLVPAAPDLHAALARLDPRTTRPQETVGGPRLLAGARRRVVPHLVETLGLRRYAADLHMLDQIPEELAARKVGYTLLGLAFPTVLAAAAGALGVSVPFAVPAAAAMVLAGALFVVPDVDLRRRATTARGDLRRATCVYLELVALERAADAGTTEALDRAATVGTTREFARIRAALLRAEVNGRPPWDGLSDLADATGVAELGDLADIMRLSGHDGAAVYATLRARAASLRTQLLTASTAKANAASEHMVVPVALLGVAFMALVAYPAFARILLS